jgi:hypothetical protein
VVLEAHFVFRYTAGSSDGESGQLSSAGVSLVLGNATMPAAAGSPLVLDTQFSVSWVNSSAPVSALQVRLAGAMVPCYFLVLCSTLKFPCCRPCWYRACWGVC